MPKHTNNLKSTGKKAKREAHLRHDKVLPEKLPATPKKFFAPISPPIAEGANEPASPDKPSIKRYEIHPLALTFPMAAGEALGALAENIKRNGQCNPATTLEGKILDGRRRESACRMAGIELRTTELPPGIDPVEYVVAQNGHRRDLSASGRAIAAAKLMPYYAAKAAKRRQVLSGTRSNPSGSQPKVQEIIPEPGECGEAREAAAKAVGANPRNVSDALRLQREAPDLFHAVEAGEKTIPSAMRLLGREAQLRGTTEGSKCPGN